MIQSMKNTINKHNLINKNDKIVVAVSGGPDSIALLHGLYSLKNEYNLSLYVCHLNHQLRGDDSDGDAKYVEEICRELNIKSFIFSEDIEEYSKKNKMSFEEGAREARYRLFNKVLKETNSNKIAVAQNQNDQSETLLMRLMRGAGLEGLSAIKYKRDNIIRPLLNTSRNLIEKYCKENNLNSRTDKTNFETIYTRNKIRLEMIPYIQKNFNENIIKQLSLTADLLQDDVDYFNKEVNNIYKKIVEESKNGLEIKLENLNNVHKAILSRLIRKIIKEISGNLKEITQVHIEEIINLVKSKNHGSFKILKKNIKFEISYDYLSVYEIKEKKENVNLYFINNMITTDEYLLELLSEHLESSKESITIDLDKVVGKLFVRTRKTGDVFYPLGMKGSKKIKNYFINLKIPSSKRDDILLLCDEENIIWVIGYRMCEKYKIQKDTKEKLTIKIKYNMM